MFHCKFLNKSELANVTTFHDPDIFRYSQQKCSIKTMFLKISQNSKENTCARESVFNKVSGLQYLRRSASLYFFSKLNFFYHNILIQKSSENSFILIFYYSERQFLFRVFETGRFWLKLNLLFSEKSHDNFSWIIASQMITP